MKKNKRRKVGLVSLQESSLGVEKEMGMRMRTVKARDPPISPDVFYNRLKQSVEKLLLSKEDVKLSR